MNLLIISQKVDKNDQLLGFFIEWLRRFADKFEKITVLCLEKGDFDLPENIKVISLGKDRGANKLNQLITFYHLLFSLRGEYDSVFVHMNPIWAVLGGLPWRVMNKKIFFWYTHKAVTLKLKLAEKMANVIFTASPESFRLQSKKVIVTGHGIDTDLFKPNTQLPVTNYKLPRILSVGRIAPVKNYETLIEAARILKEKGLDFSVTMIGEAPLEKDKEYENKLKLLITDYELQGHFKFVGKVGHNDLPSYYQSHDIFIHLSKTGSLDKTVLEAMASGMKVLSSNDSAKSFLPKELIFDENNPEDLAKKIGELLGKVADDKLRDNVVKNHNLSKLINKLSETINVK